MTGQMHAEKVYRPNKIKNHSLHRDKTHDAGSEHSSSMIRSYLTPNLWVEI